MKTRIVNGVEPLLAEELTREYQSCSRLRRRMVDLLEKDIDAAHVSMRDEEMFKSSSWPEYQASKIGEVRALLKIISLLE